MLGVLKTPTGQIVIENNDTGRYIKNISHENLILKKEITRLRIKLQNYETLI